MTFAATSWAAPIQGVVGLTGVQGTTDPTGSVYIAPYFGTLKTGMGGTQNVSLYCVDPNHESYLGTSWKVYETNLGTGNLSDTRLGNAGKTTYDEMAYLYFDSGYSTTKIQGGQQAIEAAVWDLASGDTSQWGKPSGNVTQAEINYWITQAEQDYKEFNYNNVLILTDISGQNQEFMSETPEPVSLSLFGTGMVGLAGSWLRRRRAARRTA
jgi:hypothetical protein